MSEINRIQEELDNLPKTMDKVIFLTKEGYDNEQIAKTLGSTIASISSFKSRARREGLLEREVKTANLSNIASTITDEEKEVEMNISRIDDMEFPEFFKYNTGTVIDKIASDYEEDGGFYSGTVTICTGESGVGKSTLLVDLLAKIQEYETERGNEDFDSLYISTEMTRNDIYFYKRKMPAIGKLKTLIASDYIRQGGLKTIIEKAFLESDHNIILLDSYQDLVEKFKEVCGWASTKIETWLINLMVEAAEKTGKLVIAVQHLTKGGQFVGKTYLKHTTTAMLEIRFDGHNNRYITYSKNRRGGSMTHLPMYFSLDENGNVVYDEAKFTALLHAGEFSKDENKRKEEMAARFESVFAAIPDKDNNDEDGGVEEVVIWDSSSNNKEAE